MIFIFIMLFFVACYLSVCFRLAVLHPVSTIYYAVHDIFYYFYYRQWRILKAGQLVIYTALFGRGKTLSVVHYIVKKYQRYNGLMIYDRDRKKWVKQVVNVISNVQLAIPYENFVSLKQIVAAADRNKQKDIENDTYTVTLVLGDEFGVQMNSRSFKTNVDPLFLNTLLTCRHHHISLFYDAQRFNHVDALLRQVTGHDIECKKVWRFMVHYYFDAYQLECASSPSLIQPFRRTGWFVRDKDYASYDTLACVDNLSKKVEEGDMMSEEEIMKLRVNEGNAGLDGVTKPSRYLKRRRLKKSG